MLCFVSITGSAVVSTMYVFGVLQSTGECVPKSYDWKTFSSVEWALLSDDKQMVIMTGKEQQLAFVVNREYTDSKNGVKVFDAIEGQTGASAKLYYYLNEEVTKQFSKDGDYTPVYEMDIYDYMNRTILSILFTEIK